MRCGANVLAYWTAGFSKRALEDLTAHGVLDRDSVANRPPRWSLNNWSRERLDAIETGEICKDGGKPTSPVSDNACTVCEL
jgi:hypothetical protein